MTRLASVSSPSIAPAGKFLLRWLRRASPRAYALAVLVCRAALLVLGAGGASAQVGNGWEEDNALREWQPVQLTFEGPERSETAATFRDVRFNLRVRIPSGRQLVVRGEETADVRIDDSVAEAAIELGAEVDSSAVLRVG